MENNKLLSLILLSYYSKERINTCYDRLTEVLGLANIPFELIVMDDGSKDNSYQVAQELASKHSNVKAYQLSRNFTSHYSIFAGLSVCTGACAMPIPDDEQQPYDTIIKMYQLWENGSKVIIPHRISRDDPFFSKLFSEMFYKIMTSLSDVKFPKGGADSFFIDRELIDILNARITPINTSSITEVLRLGFDPYFLAYDRPLGDNKKSRWSLKKKVKLALDFFYSSSSFPIKLITYMGTLFSLFSALIIVFYILTETFNLQMFGFHHVPGWTSLIVFISFFSGLILLSLGIIAEYIWRIYEVVKNRPGFLIKKKD